MKIWKYDIDYNDEPDIHIGDTIDFNNEIVMSMNKTNIPIGSRNAILEINTENSVFGLIFDKLENTYYLALGEKIF